jgi:FMN phosphatase YigB (HAD superfamily)
MSNISQPDFDAIRMRTAAWDIFDKVFTSCAAGERKPHLGFYRHVLAETGSNPHSTVFVDDKLENVLSARSLGLHGIIFDSHEVKRTLRNVLGDPIARGQQYLKDNAGHLNSVTDDGHALNEIRENFTQLLIWEATGDR